MERRGKNVQDNGLSQHQVSTLGRVLGEDEEIRVRQEDDPKSHSDSQTRAGRTDQVNPSQLGPFSSCVLHGPGHSPKLFPCCRSSKRRRERSQEGPATSPVAQRRSAIICFTYYRLWSKVWFEKSLLFSNAPFPENPHQSCGFLFFVFFCLS